VIAGRAVRIHAVLEFYKMAAPNASTPLKLHGHAPRYPP
jgi:hypothetical protein